MSQALKKRFYTLAEYFALIKDSDERYEYWDGEIFCMSGNKKEHVYIEEDLFATLRQLLKGHDCQAFSSSMALKVPAVPPLRYADAGVACGAFEFEEVSGIDLLLNPVLLVEILSHSTQSYDKKAKFNLYKSIPTFREYLLISKEEPRITQHVRQEDSSWLPYEVIGLRSSIYLPSIDCWLNLSDVYQRVKFKSKHDKP